MRSRRRRVRSDTDIVAPSSERAQHGAVERLPKPIADDAGSVARPYRAIDLLAAMERRGAITASMRQAGEDFRRAFQRAHFDPLHAADLKRVPGGYVGDEGPGLCVQAAREKVWRAICAVGGLASAGGSCLWHVVGLERSIKEWALEQGWAGRRLSQETASGVLIAALGALETHFGTSTV
jgi:Domain of unknown function (DUF6456)